MDLNISITYYIHRTVSHKSHDPYIHAFLMEARVMTFVAHCTLYLEAAKGIHTNIRTHTKRKRFSERKGIEKQN